MNLDLLLVKRPMWTTFAELLQRNIDLITKNTQKMH